VLKKRFRTVTHVPTAPEAGLGLPNVAPSTSTTAAPCISAVRLRSDIRDTLAMDAKASPRNPSVAMRSRSVVSAILLVAWGERARCSSASGMPQPSSVMRMSSIPPCSRSRVMRVAPASSAFSVSSFTTLAGRSTTSPAAIWLATSVGRTLMERRVVGLSLVTG
jgi:hypothetical protein